MHVFLDANILFSAAKSEGAVRELLRMLVERGHECCADASVLAEARRNLESNGKQALDMLDALLLVVLHVAALRPPAESNPADVTAWVPEKDRPVLSAAIALGCDALVTGDRTHFGPGYGRRFRGVTICSPRSLAEYVLARG
ncbi:MAG: PIN domain-containing protein [Woeseiaceae bacterium]|nr:PIN domain-containing protein [Woeseiaceae bacterium]